MPPVSELAASIRVEGADSAIRQVDLFGSHLDQVEQKQRKNKGAADDYDASLRKVSTGALVAGSALLAGFGLAAGATMNFDKALSGVKAVSNATAGEMDHLRTAAIQAGQATVFSASEAATAEAELAKAGVSTADILGGALTGSMSLAAAGQLDLADAATISAQAMNIFKLSGADVGHIADVLASGANKSAADVGQLGDALRQGGLVAHQTGLGLEDTVGALALFADQALIGSDAGTSLKTMLQRLTPTSAEAAGTMSDLGISAYDNQGRFVGLAAFAENLKTSLGGLSAEQRNTALTTIFGSDAVRGASILMDAGAKGVTEYTKAVNDQGAASRMAATQMDNLAGDLEQLKGSVETALIQSGSGANDVLRTMTQMATGAVNAFSSLPGPLQTAAAGFAAIGGTGLIAVGAIGKIVPAVSGGMTALRSMKAGMEGGKIAGSGLVQALGGLGPTLGIAGGALAIGAIAIDQWGAAERAAKQMADEFTQAITADSDALGENTQKLLASKIAAAGMTDDFNKAGIGIGEATRAMGGSGDDLNKLWAALRGGGGVGDVDAAGLHILDWAKAVHTANIQAGESAKFMGPAAESIDQVGTASDGAAGAVSDYAEAAQQADDETKNFKDALDSLLGIHVDTQSAMLRFRDDLAGLTDAFADNGLSLDANTEKGRKNQAAWISATNSGMAYAEAVKSETGSTDAATFAAAGHVLQLAETARQSGKTEAEVVSFLGELYKIPPDVLTTMHTDDEVAKFVAEQLRLKYDGLSGDLNARANLDTQEAERRVATLKAHIASISGGASAQWVDTVARTLDGRGGMGHADGTISTREHMAMISEGNTTEVIAPLNNPTRAWSLIAQSGLLDTMPAGLVRGGDGNQGMTIQIGALQALNPRDLSRDVAARLSWELMTSGMH